MNYTEQAISMAYDNGYKRPMIIHPLDFALAVVPAKNLKDRSKQKIWQAVIFLDPLFWQALGKGLGWGEKACMECGFNGRFDDYHGDCGICTGKAYAGWQFHWHCFIDSLAEGKNPEGFFKELIEKK